MSLSASGAGTVLRLTVRLTVLSGGPRIRSTASFSVIPSTLLPSMPRIRSPGFMPARAAGVSSIGEITVISPSVCCTSRPSPPKWPLIWVCRSLNCFGVR